MLRAPRHRVLRSAINVLSLAEKALQDQLRVDSCLTQVLGAHSRLNEEITAYTAHC